MMPARTFPIRLAPLPGEDLDSWLEALAHRLNVRLGDVLGELGLAAAFQHGVREVAVPTDWTIALRDEEAARIAYATGAAPRYLGSSEACTLIDPSRGIDSNSEERICP